MIKILKRFHYFLLKNKPLFGVFMLISIVAVVLENVRPYFYKLLIDGATNNQYQGVLTILLVYGGSWIVADILRSVANYFGDRIISESSVDARVTIFKRVQDLDFAYHVEKNTGSLISAFKRGDNAFFSLYWNIYREIIPIGISILVMFYFFGGVSLKFVWILTGLLTVNGALAGLLIKKNLKKRAEFNSSEDEISAIITDNLINYETVKFFAQENQEEKRLRTGFKKWVDKFYGYVDTFRIIDVTIGCLSLLAMTGVMYLMINDLQKGNLTLGDFTMVTAFMGGFYYRFFGLIWQIRNIAKDYTDIEKYFSILDEEIIVKDAQICQKINQHKGKIEFRDVSFVYPKNNKRVLSKINLVIEPGESVAFVGRSGAGKTTLVKLLLRFYDLSGGQILVDNVDISKMSKSYLRSLLGVVPQEPVLFNNTIGFNIKYGNQRASKNLIEKAARMANLDVFINSLEEKYETIVGERGVKLSGGQKQRLAIARAMLINPKILIFDEATSNLDSESEGKIQDALWKTAKNRTTLIIAHRFSTIRKADKIVVLDKGKVAEVGNHGQLINKKGLYFKLWSMQFEDRADDGIELSGGGLTDKS